MIPLPNDISAQDVHQWLNGGFFYATVNGARRLCGYSGVDQNRLNYVLVTPIHEDGQPHVPVPFRDVAVHWPFCGALNIGPVAVFLHRLQQRQWRRTYNSRQLQLSVPRKWESMKLYGEQVRDLNPNHYDVVREAFDPTYPDFDVALDEIRNGAAFSRALNPHVIIVGTADTLLVFYKNVYVATMQEDGRLVPVNADEECLRRLLKYFNGRAVL